MKYTVDKIAEEKVELIDENENSMIIDIDKIGIDINESDILDYNIETGIFTALPDLTGIASDKNKKRINALFNRNKKN